MKVEHLILLTTSASITSAYIVTPRQPNTRVHARQSQVSWHHFENLWAHGPDCYFWCVGRKKDGSPTQDKEEFLPPHIPISDQNTTHSSEGEFKTPDESNHNTGGVAAHGKMVDTGTEPHTTGALLAARTESALPSSITAPQTSLDSTRSVLAAPTSTCTEACPGTTNGHDEHWPESTPTTATTTLSPPASATSVSGTESTSASSSASCVCMLGLREVIWTCITIGVLGWM